jgi:hypothetical protein
MILTTTHQTTSTEPLAISQAPANEPCPKCGKALVDPSGLGWCKDCGYCKSLSQDRATRLEIKNGVSLGGVVEAGGAITRLPLWFWASLLFVAIGIFFAIVMDRRLPEGSNLHRATWTSVQIAVGVLVIFLSQYSALVTIAPEEPTLSFKDALFPFKLWGLIIKRLPKLQECLWTALLGLSLIVGSSVFIGGFEHWFNYLPKTVAEQERERLKALEPKATAVIIPMD